MKVITAVTALIRDPNTGLFLGVSRKDDPTAFGLPGGKVDPGETPEEAVVRELIEETGLIADPATVKQVFIRDAEPGPDGKGFYCAAYTMSVTGTINTTEAGRVAWITKETLFAGPFGIYNKALFAAVTYCNHCQGKGKEWTTENPCHICNGDKFIVKPRALLVDDWRKPENLNWVAYAEDHYTWTVCRTNADAVVAVKDNPRFDVWFMDYLLDQFGRTTMPFLNHAHRHMPEKAPERIVVVSEHDKGKEFADTIKDMYPEATVTVPRLQYTSNGTPPPPPPVEVMPEPAPYKPPVPPKHKTVLFKKKRR